jgi:predicted nucleotide-binding protein (sugar kinase/HSP70/actin superfamily)
MTKTISFPHLGNYYIPISYLLKNITNSNILIPPKITKKTIELGSSHSPDYVCVPFKYNLGNYIEALDAGADTILQAGGGCRYGYYAELQEQILKDLNYKFTFVNFIKDNHVSLNNIYKFAKEENTNLTKIKYYHYLLNTITMVVIMDKLGKYPRENMGFEINKNDFTNTESELLQELQSKISFSKLIKIYFKYKKKYKKIPVNKPKNPIKIGLVGELYSIMEPYSSCNIERKLASLGIEVHRYTTLTYLLLIKKFKLKYYLHKGKKYLKYHLGADGTESVVLSEILAKKNYDGIVHIKSFGCTPELNAMPILEKISNDYQIPIIYFSFDSQDNEVGINTRIEAFYDMLLQKKNKYKK